MYCVMEVIWFFMMYNWMWNMYACMCVYSCGDCGGDCGCGCGVAPVMALHHISAMF